ncbi:hypothetical protein [Pseudoclavibacter helvolus]|uniref:hypothetical protein n=1 Tax=Pseudoclavibacter helvolus TaxID=255205 RepID=UPI000838D426|nr:hypothetical protein [Pseudoclavibacter helvolus]
MSGETILLFLHGVGDGDPGDQWRHSLSSSLLKLGYPTLDDARVIAPKYAHALQGADDSIPVPPITIKRPTREAARENRRAFERRTAAIEFRLGHQDGGSWPPHDGHVDLAVTLPAFAAVRNYTQKPRIRAQVLQRILDLLPTTGSVVIVAHSLGSVIGADLLRRLPVDLRVEGFVTIGSPLANANFNVEKVRDDLEDPPTNLAWWVNFWNPFDPVVAVRGLSSVFTWMIDYPVRSGVHAHVHDAVQYLADETVAKSIGFALFGSNSTDVVVQERGIDIPLDSAEKLILLALRYAYLTQEELQKGDRERYSGARRQVQATAVANIRQRNAKQGRQVPSPIADLGFDLSDPLAEAPVPRPALHLEREEAIVVLTVLASENVITPFDIAVTVDQQREAMRNLCAEMGLGARFGDSVFDAAKTAQLALNGKLGINWVKWGAIGIGAVAVVVATGGLALAAGAGLAGAAAITSALAAFGPGGMIGGLLTAGSLVGIGGGSIAVGLASNTTSAETLEAVAVRQLMAEILRKQHDVPSDPSVWMGLATTEVQVRREYERLDEFSDEASPALQVLRRKIETVSRALDFLRANGLEPGAHQPVEDSKPAWPWKTMNKGTP